MPLTPREHRFIAGMVVDVPALKCGLQTSESQLKYSGISADVLAEKQAFPGWGMIGVHVLVITPLSNLGKMFPAFCYRRQASFRERLAVTICMFPRGEVGAGVLVVSLSYGLSGPAITVAVLSLALNLLCTGLFIVAVRRLASSAIAESAATRKREAFPSTPSRRRVPALK